MFLVAGYGRFGRLLAFFFPLFSLATEIILGLICERKLDLEIAAKLSGDQLTVKKKSMKSLDIDQLMNLKAHPIVHVLNYKFSSFSEISLMNYSKSKWNVLIINSEYETRVFYCLILWHQSVTVSDTCHFLLCLV